jgi:iron complex transport system substrate-binding protein
MNRPTISLLVAGTLFAWLPCALDVAHAQTSRTISDAEGRKIEINDISRIVTIGAAVTEIVFALGHGDRVIGVDQTSTFPPAVRTKPNVGYMRALSAEGVMSLAPGLIIATEGSGPPDVIDILARASIPFVLVPEGYDEAAVLKKVRVIANVLGEDSKGEAIALAIAADFQAMRAQREKIANPRKGVFVFAVGGGTPTVGGSKTSADGIFTLSGIENAMRSVSGYKPAVAEATLAAAPDVVVTMIERNHGMGPNEMFALPAFAGTPAAKDKRLIAISSYALTFGPRAAHAAHNLAAAVYPELSLPPLQPRPWTGEGAAAKP